MDTISTRTATLASGLTLPYAETGAPAGTPVVLVHGYVESWRYFEPLLEQLPPTLHAYAPTLRGHGDAGEPDGYTLNDLAGDVLDFMDSLGLDRAAIVGSSSGGLIAQSIASSQPHRVTALVLLSTPATLADKPAVIVRWQEISELQDPLDPTFVEEFVLATSPPSLPADLVRRLVAETLKTPARVWKESLRGLIDADLPVPLPQITAPTLLIWGDQDTFITADQPILLHHIPNAHQLIYQGAAHTPHLAAPRRTATDITHFLTGTG